MLKTLVAFLIVVLPSALLAQKECLQVTIYAYQRSTLPGMVPRGMVNEKGEPGPKVNTTFYLYLELPKEKVLTVIRVWIKGVPYAATIDTVDSTPVILGKTPVGNLIRVDTLVPTTQNMVLAINLHDKQTLKPERKIAQAVKRSEIVLEYKIRIRRFYTELAEIKKLEALALQ